MLEKLFSANGWAAVIWEAFFSLIGGIIVWFFTLSIKEPVYSIQTINYISDLSSQISDFSASYKGKPVSNLSTSKIIFYNAGKQTISSSDIAQSDKIRIETTNSNIKILDARILYENRKVNLSRIESNSKSISVLFDFLDQNDGLVIQVIHDGKNDNDLVLNGTVKGVSGIPRIKFQNRATKIKFSWNTVTLFAIMSLCYSAYSSEARRNAIRVAAGGTKHKVTTLLNFILLSFIVLVTSIGILEIFPGPSNFITSFYSKITPPGYEIFDR